MTNWGYDYTKYKMHVTDDKAVGLGTPVPDGELGFFVDARSPGPWVIRSDFDLTDGAIYLNTDGTTSSSALRTSASDMADAMDDIVENVYGTRQISNTVHTFNAHEAPAFEGFSNMSWINGAVGYPMGTIPLTVNGTLFTPCCARFGFLYNALIPWRHAQYNTPYNFCTSPVIKSSKSTSLGYTIHSMTGILHDCTRYHTGSQYAYGTGWSTQWGVVNGQFMVDSKWVDERESGTHQYFWLRLNNYIMVTEKLTTAASVTLGSAYKVAYDESTELSSNVDDLIATINGGVYVSRSEAVRIQYAGVTPYDSASYTDNVTGIYALSGCGISNIYTGGVGGSVSAGQTFLITWAMRMPYKSYTSSTDKGTVYPSSTTDVYEYDGRVKLNPQHTNTVLTFTNDRVAMNDANCSTGTEVPSVDTDDVYDNWEVGMIFNNNLPPDKHDENEEYIRKATNCPYYTTENAVGTDSDTHWDVANELRYNHFRLSESLAKFQDWGHRAAFIGAYMTMGTSDDNSVAIDDKYSMLRRSRIINVNNDTRYGNVSFCNVVSNYYLGLQPAWVRGCDA